MYAHFVHLDAALKPSSLSMYRVSERIDQMALDRRALKGLKGLQSALEGPKRASWRLGGPRGKWSAKDERIVFNFSLL